MNTDISKRILYTIACFFAAVFFPYWLVYVAAAFGMYWFPWYVEGVAAVFFGDILFAAPLARFHHILWVGTLLMLFVFIVMEIIKGTTRYGHS